jgi:hypothetical protein
VKECEGGAGGVGGVKDDGVCVCEVLEVRGTHWRCEGVCEGMIECCEDG